MPEPTKRTCVECGEEAEQLHRRLWFRSWGEALSTGKLPVEIHFICDDCRGSERRRSLLYLGIVLVAIVIVAVVLLVEFRK